jgi:hypothetical protein
MLSRITVDCIKVCKDLLKFINSPSIDLSSEMLHPLLSNIAGDRDFDTNDI